MTTHPAAKNDDGTARTPAEGAEPRVIRNDDEGRYEIWLSDVLGGFTEFAPDSDGRLDFSHTEIDPAFKGEGLGKTLVKEAMKDVASRDETVVPTCRFVRRYLSKHDVPGLKVAHPEESSART